MKLLVLRQFIFSDFYFSRIRRNYVYSFKNVSDIFCFYNYIIIFDLKMVFLKLKKILNIVRLISYRDGIFFTLILDKYKDVFKINEMKDVEVLDNFYIMLMKGIFGFVSNLQHYLVQIEMEFLTENTNYKSSRYPAIVFLTKNCWKKYHYYFMLYVKLRILTLKTNYYYDYDRNFGYNIYINDCSNLFNIIKFLYKYNYINKKKYYKILFLRQRLMWLKSKRLKREKELKKKKKNDTAIKKKNYFNSKT